MFTGVVFKDNKGVVKKLSMPHSNMSSFIGSINPWNLLFAVNGDDLAKIDAIISAVALAADQQSNKPFIVNPPHTSRGAWYVYAYFDNPVLNWADCFYIGKGNNQRSTQHVSDALTFPPYKFTRKHHRILAWLKHHGLSKAAVKVAQNEAMARGLVRQLQVFYGPHAETQAFYVEYFLITHIAGTYNVENATNGNRKNDGCTAIARSAGLDETNPNHVSAWGNTIDEFIKDPYSKSIDNLWFPVTRLLIAAPFATILTHQLGLIGLVPIDMTATGMGRPLPPSIIMPHINMAVRGAADATLSYKLPKNRAYRLEIKISATELRVVINLRRLAGPTTNNEFINYFNNVTLPHAAVSAYTTNAGTQLSNFYIGQAPIQRTIHDFIRDLNKDPYYKPYALDANGEYDTSFNLANLAQRTDGKTNWIVGQNFSFSLLEAIELISKAFI